MLLTGIIIRCLRPVSEGERLEKELEFEAKLTLTISQNVRPVRALVSLNFYYACCWLCGLCLLIFFCSAQVRAMFNAP